MSTRPTTDGRPCPVCGGNNFRTGSLVHDATFNPDHITKFFALSGALTVLGRACIDCGHLELRVDPHKLQDLTRPKT